MGTFVSIVDTTGRGAERLLPDWTRGDATLGERIGPDTLLSVRRTASGQTWFSYTAEAARCAVDDALAWAADGARSPRRGHT